MAVALERLAQEALALSDQERAELAHKLLVSHEGPPDEGRFERAFSVRSLRDRQMQRLHPTSWEAKESGATRETHV